HTSEVFEVAVVVYEKVYTSAVFLHDALPIYGDGGDAPAHQLGLVDARAILLNGGLLLDRLFLFDGLFNGGGLDGLLFLDDRSSHGLSVVGDSPAACENESGGGEDCCRSDDGVLHDGLSERDVAVGVGRLNRGVRVHVLEDGQLLHVVDIDSLGQSLLENLIVDGSIGVCVHMFIIQCEAVNCQSLESAISSMRGVSPTKPWKLVICMVKLPILGALSERLALALRLNT